ncbi:YceH family protein [Opitutales bacterium ASA1]|uniref:YceH family protein n=1 Tax=Congregicoccus parvus TaxID=3081749 RepID=UPI002B29BD1A|nr:YceH family protein [Opitutales bacterium ASA1]
MHASSDSSAPANSSQPLSPLEARVLGCLIEKELTTPEYYPLSLNALVNACNQKSNRHPVLAVGPREVETALDGLRQLRLAGLFAGADARVAKYKQTLDLVYPMETADRVVLCELLLRGPQTPGELRGRCERMHPFPDVAAVEAALERLAGRPAGPLVKRLPRQSGQKEVRSAQLLTGEPDLDGASAGSAPDSSPDAPLAVSLRLPPEAEARIAALENDVATLRAQLADLRRQLGVD